MAGVCLILITSGQRILTKGRIAVFSPLLEAPRKSFDILALYKSDYYYYYYNEWFQVLTGRSYCVLDGGKTSSVRYSSDVLPQSSILDPLLFNSIYSEPAPCLKARRQAARIC